MRVLLLLTLSAPLVGASPQAVAGDAEGSPRYVESSAGLGEPGLDGGYIEVEFGDVNADGHVDLVSVGDHGSPFVNTQQHGVMVWFGDGRGAFSVFQEGNFGYGGVALGDVNDDGLMDVGYGVHHAYSRTAFGDQLLEVALGDGTGQAWTPWDAGLAEDGQSWGMSGTAFGDIDNDGDLDVGANAFGCCDGVHVYRNRGDGSWQRTFGFLGSNSRMNCRMVDIDNDGNVDLAVRHQLGTVWMGDGAGDFARADTGLPSFAALAGLALGDVNGDGDLEFATASSAGIALYTLGTEGTWVRLAVQGLPTGGPFRAAQLEDCNGDGRVDVVAFGGGQGALFLQRDGLRFVRAAEFAAPRSGAVEWLRVDGDVDHNGWLDVVLVQDEPTGGIFGGGRNRLYAFREMSKPDRLRVRVLRPSARRVLVGGSVRFVDWLSAAPTDRTSVRVELSTAGVGGPWATVASGLPNNGRFQWTVPRTVTSTARLRVTVKEAGDGPEVRVASALSDRFEIR
ncbi:MAG: VCBS repeat-containing protein [Planctomycetota bacterium]